MGFRCRSHSKSSQRSGLRALLLTPSQIQQVFVSSLALPSMATSLCPLLDDPSRFAVGDAKGNVRIGEIVRQVSRHAKDLY